MSQPLKAVISLHSIREREHYPILQLRGIRLREAEWLAKGHTGRGAQDRKSELFESKTEASGYNIHQCTISVTCITCFPQRHLHF